MSFSTWLSFLRRAPARRTDNPRGKRRQCDSRLQVESLEDRLTPSGSYLYVASYGTDNVLRYHETTGAFVDEFVLRNSSKLTSPEGMAFSPHDHNLYVAGGFEGGPGQHKSVFRFDGATGAFIDEFVEPGHLDVPLFVLFGPDGNLYVSDFGSPCDGIPGMVVRFNGTTGKFLDNFVAPGSAGFTTLYSMVFGPSGRLGGKLVLYLGGYRTYYILHFDGTTGAFLGEFVASGSGGLDHMLGMTFGPDANLYVTSRGDRTGNAAVLRYQGPDGKSPGAFLDTFVTAGKGGLLTPDAVLFGPDGNGDGVQDLYVTSLTTNGADKGMKGTNTVMRYDGRTGTPLPSAGNSGAIFLVPDSGGLRGADFMIFAETDPTTLAYRGGNQLPARSSPARPVNQSLRADIAQPLLAEATTRWQGGGADPSGLAIFEIRITDLGGTTLGLASGRTIWLDDNAGGWGWFVDPTPGDDSEFATPGDQGEQDRMDLLSVLAHEFGHLLGHDHENDGVMIETLSTGIRRMPGDSEVNDWSAILAVLVSEPLSKRRW
jgi:DNA-binding beta-propeller fold protein YncE